MSFTLDDTQHLSMVEKMRNHKCDEYLYWQLTSWLTETVSVLQKHNEQRQYVCVRVCALNLFSGELQEQ